MARGPDSTPVGTVVVDEDGMSWGYGPFLRRYGADEGDVLVIEFDVAAAEVTLRLEGFEHLDARQGAGT